MKNAFLLMGLAAVSLMSGPAIGGPLTVVELFTSQGCSSCPPANANLIEISGRPEILALSFAVTYWDRLGWKDTFGQETFTDRQRVYEPALGEAGPFTPQMVVNGKASIVGNQLGDVEQAIADADPITGPDLRSSAGRFGSVPATCRFRTPMSGSSATILRQWRVPVGRGENTGRTLAHTHVVHALELLGSWTGTATSFDVATATPGLHTAVLVQGTGGGPILAAVTD